MLLVVIDSETAGLLVNEDIHGQGNVTLRVNETTPDNTSNSLSIAAGTTVQTVEGGITLIVGDDLDFPGGATPAILRASDSVTVYVDLAGEDNDDTGSTVNLHGTLVTTLATVTSGGNNDTFNITPSLATPLDLRGDGATMWPGDQLTFSEFGTIRHSSLGTGIIDSVFQPVSFTDMDVVTTASDERTIDFRNQEFVNYRGSSQNISPLASDIEITDSGTTLKISRDHWQAIPYPSTITPDSVLSFEFRTYKQGEIHGIGFDNQLTASSRHARSQTFQIHGTQRFGIRDFANYSEQADFNGWAHFEIPVGQYYTGDFDFLFFVNDHDSKPRDAEGMFRNIRLVVPAQARVSQQGVDVANSDYIPDTNDGTDFGLVALGTLVPAHEFTVHNDGGSPLHLLLSQDELPDGFLLTEGLSTSIEPGQSDTFSIQLETDVAQTVTGPVRIFNSVAGSTPFQFSITGEITGPAAHLEVDCSGLEIANDGTGAPHRVVSFGDHRVDNDDPTQDCTFSNSGDLTLAISSISLAPGDGFTFSDIAPLTLSPGESTEWSLSMDTANPGSFTSELVIAGTVDQGADSSVTFTGTVIGEALDFRGREIHEYRGSSQNTSMQAGDVVIEDSGATLNISRNHWLAIDHALTITSDTILEFDFNSLRQGEVHGIGFDTHLNASTGRARSRTFQLHGTQTLGNQDFNTYPTNTDSDGWKHFAIPVGQYYTGDVSYLFFVNDHDGGSRNAHGAFRNLQILTDAQIRVTGQGITIADNDHSVSTADGTDFGQAVLGTVGPTREFTVHNDGGSPLALNLTQEDIPDGFQLLDGLPAVLAAGQSASMTVRLSTDDGGSQSGQIKIFSSNRDDTVHSFTISGIVTTPAASITVSCDDSTQSDDGNLEFGSVRVGDTPITVECVIGNVGESQLLVNSIGIVPTSGFDLNSETAPSLAPGEESAFSIEFQTSSIGTYESELRINSNDPHAALFNVRLTGTIVGPAVDFRDYQIEPFRGSSQNPSTHDGDITVSDAGSTLHIRRNHWQAINATTTLTADTVLAFDFKSPQRGEIHGIGFATTLSPSRSQAKDHTFQLYGSQNWGNQDYHGYPSFSDEEGWQHFEIPVGQHYTGDFSHIFFVNDDDRGSNNAEGIFRNLVISTPVQISVFGQSISIVNGATSASATDGTDFGTVPQDSVGPTREFTVHNTGDEEFTLSLAQDDLPSGFTLLSGLPVTMAAGATAVTRIQLTTTTPGTYSGPVTIHNALTDQSLFTFTIQGQVVTQTARLAIECDGAAVSTDDTISFVRNDIESPIPTRDCQLSSVGELPLNIGNVTLSPSGDFAFTGETNMTLPPGGIAEFTLQFIGETQGAHESLLVINSNDANVPEFEIRLNGLFGNSSINFSDYTIEDFRGNSQNPSHREGDIVIEDDGVTLHINRNHWQAIETDTTITADTVLEFDFRSSRRGEIHGIGFAPELKPSRSEAKALTFQLYGSQNWGNQDFDTYPGDADASGWLHYVIPVGDYYTGAYTYLFFVNDDDSGAKDGESVFSNVTIR